MQLKPVKEPSVSITEKVCKEIEAVSMAVPDTPSPNKPSSAFEYPESPSVRSTPPPPELSKEELDAQQVLLRKKGYSKVRNLATTLQGSIAKYLRFAVPEGGVKGQATPLVTTPVEVVVKITRKDLHARGVVYHNGKMLNVLENIESERRVNERIEEARSLMPAGSRPEFTSFLEAFEDPSTFYLVTEFGGQDLFHWVVRNHARIADNSLELKAWRKHVRSLFSQAVHALSWLHKEVQCAHLDLSLENLLVSARPVLGACSSQAACECESLPPCQLKLCDFGVSQLFESESEMRNCSKFVGKKGYKAPEVYAKKGKFDARKADAWSLAVILFCTLVGAPPFEKASPNDNNYYAVVTCKKLKYLLVEYKRLKFMSKFGFDLLNQVLVVQDERPTVSEMLSHPYVLKKIH